MINHIDLRSMWDRMIGSHQYIMQPTIYNLCGADVYVGLSKPMIPCIALRGRFGNENIFRTYKVGCVAICFKKHDHSSDSFLIVECRDLECRRFFEYFVSALLVELHEKAASLDCVFSMVCNFADTWKSVFVKERNTEEIGLIGELYFFYSFLSKHPDSFIVWNYPVPSTKDFSLSDAFFEVKTTTRRNVDTIEIHGLDQLSIPPGKKLYIPFIRVEAIKGGLFTVESLMKTIGIDRLTPDQRKKIHSVISESEKLEYNILEEKVYEVDASFPKLTREELQYISNGTCIMNASYSLDLSGLDSTPLSCFLDNIVF